MHFSKFFTSIIITFLLFSMLFPCFVFAIDDSGYIWSSFSEDSILTSSDVNSQNSNVENTKDINEENNENKIDLFCASNGRLCYLP